MNGFGFVTSAPLNGEEINCFTAFLGTFPRIPGSCAATGMFVISFSPSKIVAICVVEKLIVADEPPP